MSGHYNTTFFVGDLDIAEYVEPIATYDRSMFGTWLVRVWIGDSGDKNDFAGHEPDVIIYDNRGHTLSRSLGKARHVGAGGMVQKVMNHGGSDGINWHPSIPEYIRIFAGGDDGICISGVMVSTNDPDSARIWTADTMTRCDWPEIQNLVDNNGTARTGYSDSRTMIAGRKSKCLWLDRNDSDGLKVKGINLHVPSFVATPEKREAYRREDRLICNGSPRQKIMFNPKSVEHPDSTRWPLFTFAPILEFEPGTLLDKRPDQIISYDSYINMNTKPYDEGKEGSTYNGLDFGAAHPRQLISPDLNPLVNATTSVKRDEPAPYSPSGTPRSHPYEMLPPPLHPLLESTPPDFDVAKPEGHPLPPIVHPQERKLIISDGAISAMSHCYLDTPHEKVDYLSLQEKIYCDTILHTMYPLCDAEHNKLCFDKDAVMLRRHEDLELDMVNGNITVAEHWGGLGMPGFLPPLPLFPLPLFGIPYSNWVNVA